MSPVFNNKGAPGMIPAGWLFDQPPKNFVPILVYAVVSIIVLWGLLAPGYVLTLDMVFTPNGSDIDVSDWFYGFDTWIFGGLPFFLIIKGIGSIVPMWLIQKVLLFLTLFLSGFSAHSLCPSKSQCGKYFAGLIYMLNPFVYVRFMAGHWLILLAYAVVPFAIKAILNFLEQPDLKKALNMTLLITLVGVFNSQILLLVLITSLIIFVAKLIQIRGNRAALMKLIRGTGLSLGAFTLLNVYWVVPILTTQTTTLSQITRDDLRAFVTDSGGAGPNVLFSLATMHGFWREGYRYISDILPSWYVIFFFFLFLVIYGFISKFRDSEIGHYVKALGVTAIVSIILASGISTPYFSGLFEYLFDHIFFMKGFRESQKFVALLVLAYSYLGGIGVGEFSQQLTLREGISRGMIGKILLCTLAISSPFIYNVNMLFGFSGQMSTQEYPSEWYEANQYLNQHKGDYNTLFLPWHWYMDFTWLGDRIINPAESFFDKPLIQGENIEIGPIETQSVKPEQHYIHFLLKHSGEINNLGEFLAPLNIKYIILAKEVDYLEYDFLYAQTDLKVVMDNAYLVVFENMHSVTKFSYTNSLSQLKDTEELSASFGSEDSDILDYAYLLGGGGGIDSGATSVSLDYATASPVKYKFGPQEEGFIVFSAPYDDGWVLDGQEAVSNIGVTNAFAVAKSIGDITLHYKRFWMLFIGYLVSLVSFLSIVTALVLTRRRES